MRETLAPLRLPAFRLLLAGRTINALGNAFAPIALAFAVLDLTGSARDLGLVVGTRMLVNVLFLLLGCLFDATTLLLVLVPLFLPAARNLGIDLVHFGVVIVVNIMIGLITPPYGVLLFVMSGLTGIPLREIIREIWAFIAILISALLLMIFVPDVVLGLPKYFGYIG